MANSHLLQILIGQIGAKKQRRLSHSLLLTKDELPGDDWIASRRLSWRIGAFSDEPVRRRAWKEGLFTAVQGYRQMGTKEHVRVQVFLLANENDAQILIREVRSREIVKPNVFILNDRQVAGPGIIWECWRRSTLNLTSKQKWGMGKNWRFYGAVNSVAILVNASGFNGFWTWEKVLPPNYSFRREDSRLGERELKTNESTLR